MTAIDPKLNVTVSIFDGANRLVETQRQMRQVGDGSMPPASNQSFLTAGKGIIRTEMICDGNSRLSDLVDDRGNATTYTYDSLDRQLTMTFADGSVRSSAYDPANDLITYTDENGSVFNYTVDALGRRTASAITPATGVLGTTAQAFAFDGLSRITQAIDTVSSSAEVDFYYDSLSRTLEEAQTYDGSTRYVTRDQWTSWVATDLTYPNTRQVASGYDALYRRNSVTESSGGASIANWQFFGPGRIVEQTLGNGLICTQMNNTRTHSAVQTTVSNPAWGNVSSDKLGYDGVGRMIAKRFLDGGINGDSGAYNNTTALVGFTTGFDRASNKYYERALHAEDRSSLYQPFNSDFSLQSGYDSANRLLQYQRGVLSTTGGYANLGGGSIATPISLPNTDTNRIYNLDGLGNWKSTTYTPEGGSSTTEVRQHNSTNQLTKFGSTPVLYDHGNNASSSDPLVQRRGNGNIVNDGTRSLQFDALNRLVQVSNATGTTQWASYAYDALGRRIRKTVTSGGITGDSPDLTIDYLYDGAQSIEERNDADDSVLRQYVWGQYIDEATQMKTYTTLGGGSLPAGTYYPLQDLLYRTTALTDSSGNIKEAYDTDAYGNTLIFTAPGSGSNWWTNDATQGTVPACERIFCGYQYDPETQLYSVRARIYEPELGRWVSRDPIGYFDSGNLYSYGIGTPCTTIDPHGLSDSLPGVPSDDYIDGYDIFDFVPITTSPRAGLSPAIGVPSGTTWWSHKKAGFITGQYDRTVNENQVGGSAVWGYGIHHVSPCKCVRAFFTITDYSATLEHHVVFQLHELWETTLTNELLSIASQGSGIAGSVVGLVPYGQVPGLGLSVGSAAMGYASTRDGTITYIGSPVSNPIDAVTYSRSIRYRRVKVLIEDWPCEDADENSERSYAQDFIRNAGT